MNPLISTFVKQGGEVAKGLGVMTAAQIDTIIYGQALIDTAKAQGVELGNPDQLFKQYNSLPALQQLAQSKGFNTVEVGNLAASFDRGTYPQHAPKFMNIADMAGFLSKKASNTLLGAQAAARVAETVESLKQGVPSRESLADTLDPNNKRNAIKGYPGEPSYVEASQSADHTARIMAAAISENPQLAHNKEIKGALTALELLAGQGFKEASKDAKKQGLTVVGKQMEAARDSQRSEVHMVAMVSSTSTLISKLEKGMIAVAQHNPQHASQIQELMQTRKVQMQKLNVFGSQIAPDMFFGRDDSSSFVDRLNQQRDGPQNGGRGV